MSSACFMAHALLSESAAANMLKNSQRAARVGLLCFPSCAKDKGPKRSDILWGQSGREGGHWFHAFCRRRLERRISFRGSKRQQVGKGAAGRQAKGRGAGAFAVHPAERLHFSQPPSDPSDRPKLQGNYGNAALKPSIAFFQPFLGTKQRQ